MFLAVDIGNTNIKLGLFERERILSVRRLETDKNGSVRQYQRKLKRLLGAGRRIDAVLICSVVPKVTLVIKKALYLLFKTRPLILGRDITAPIKNLYKEPKQVGQDRLLNALAAFNKYGAPVVVVDFGTALTFDVVGSKGSYLGGVIVPGMELALKALIRNAALLPQVGLDKPGALLGRETSSSMKSGIVYGYAFLVEGILQALNKQLKRDFRVVATGGEANLMLRYCPSIKGIDENLTLEGLNMAFQGIRKAKKISKKIKIG